MDTKFSNSQILVVDDDPSALKYVEKVISTLGCRIVAASGGARALQAARAADASIDLLLTDVIMPGMSGPQLANAFKEIYPEAKVVFMSGSGNIIPLMKEYTDRHGELDYLPKPFTPKELTRMLEKCLE